MLTHEPELSLNQYRAIFATMPAAFFLGEIIRNEEGRLVDLRVLEANDAFYQQTGLPRGIIGQPALQYLPHMEASWRERYGSVALTGQPVRFESYNADTDRYYDVYCYSPEPGRFVSLFWDISERVRVEQALHEQKHELSQMVAGLPGLVWTASASGFADYHSPQWLTYTGMPTAELQGNGWLSALHPEDRADVSTAWMKATANSTPYSVNYRIRRHDGVYRRFNARGVPLRNETGQVIRWFGICTDIEDLQRAQEALEESERRYSALFNNRLNAVIHGRVVTDAAGRPVDYRYEKVNEAFERLVGLKAADVEGHLQSEIFPEPQSLEPDYISLFGSVALDGGERRLEAYSPRNRRWFDVYVHSHTRGEFTVIFSDITERKQARAELEGFFKQAEVGVLIVDNSGNILRANHFFFHLLGYTESELEAMSFAVICHPDDLPRNMELFQRLARGEISHYTLEKRFRHKNGHYIWCISAVARGTVESGAKPYIVDVTTEIQASKQLEQELRQAHQELESRVEQRTRELRQAQRQAEEALRDAEAANRAKSGFLATMSHEIRTPLNGVIGFTGLLLDGPLTEEKRPYAELARQSGESLLHLLNDFLDFSKIEAGRLELEPVAFDLYQELQQVLALVQPDAQEKGLALKRRIRAPRWLRGDATRLRQILLNLLSNAVKFTLQGQVLLHCQQTSRQGTTIRICFQVIDTGIGIDDSTRHRLFQPFVQADSITRRFGGTGLGLAISRRLVEVMNGAIGFNSTRDKGSTFWVELPFELLPVAETPEAKGPRAQEAPAKTRYRGRVLVVDDNSVSQLLAAEILKRLGCQVDVVGNGLEAVEACAQLPYDLVLMDCDMPVMDGYEATRRIRARETPGRHVPIVAMTASALQGDAERCLAAGMDAFLSKPLRLQQLSSTISNWLKPG